MSCPTTFISVILISHEHLHGILMVLKMGLVKILRWISVVQIYEHLESENGFRTYRLLSGFVWPGAWAIWSKKKTRQIFTRKSPPPCASLSWRPSCSSCKSCRGKLHQKVLTNEHFRGHYRNPKLKCKIFLMTLFKIWNQWRNMNAIHIQISLHCKGPPIKYVRKIFVILDPLPPSRTLFTQPISTIVHKNWSFPWHPLPLSAYVLNGCSLSGILISMTMAGITKWLKHIIHRLHSNNWFKFEDPTPTG